MIPVQSQPGYYWRTNDDADLAFSTAKPEQPTHISCYNLHDSLNHGLETNVPVVELTLMAKAEFGERKVGWTGSAYRFGIYHRKQDIGCAQIVVIVSHGGGMEAYLLSDLVAVSTWTYIAECLSEELRWNLCYEVLQAHRSVQDGTRREIYRKFLEGRLKKRKKANRVWVEVLPARAQPEDRTHVRQGNLPSGASGATQP